MRWKVGGLEEERCDHVTHPSPGRVSRSEMYFTSHLRHLRATLPHPHTLFRESRVERVKSPGRRIQDAFNSFSYVHLHILTQKNFMHLCKMEASLEFLDVDENRLYYTV